MPNLCKLTLADLHRRGWGAVGTGSGHAKRDWLECIVLGSRPTIVGSQKKAGWREGKGKTNQLRNHLASAPASPLAQSQGVHVLLSRWLGTIRRCSVVQTRAGLLRQLSSAANFASSAKLQVQDLTSGFANVACPRSASYVLNKSAGASRQLLCHEQVCAPHAEQ